MVIEQELHTRIAKLEKLLDYLESNPDPTFPIYDSSNYPQDVVNGQIALTLDGQVAWYTNDTWFESISGAVVGLTEQDPINGQAYIGFDGSLNIYCNDQWYEIITIEVPLTTLPQDMLPGQIFIGTGDQLFVTPDGITFYVIT